MSTTATAHLSPTGTPRLTSRRRRLVHLVSALLAIASATLVGAAPAHALDDEVCLKWSTSYWGYIDSKGNDITVFETRCDFWMSAGGDRGDDGPPKEPGTPPPGPGGTVDRDDKEYCETVKADLAAERAALALALAQQQAAQDDLERLTFASAGDHAAYVRARDDYARAVVALDHVTAMYAAENDTTVEREVKAGVTISRSLPVNPFLMWGPEVIAAQQQLASARAAMDKAWSKWSGASNPALQAAQQRVDAIEQTIMTAPGRIETLQRELHDHC